MKALWSTIQIESIRCKLNSVWARKRTCNLVVQLPRTMDHDDTLNLLIKLVNHIQAEDCPGLRTGLAQIAQAIAEGIGNFFRFYRTSKLCR